MSAKIFTNGFALIIMLSIARLNKASLMAIKAEIERCTDKKIKPGAISASLKLLENRQFVSRVLEQQEGEKTRGQRDRVYIYRLNEAGRKDLKWLLNAIDLLRSV